MADRNIQVLAPALSFELLTLEEAKIMMGIAVTDTSNDQQLQLFNDINSARVMRLCNRIFAREKVRESWRDIDDRRIFLSHWPVHLADIESVQSGGYLYPYQYELEEGSGKLSCFTGWSEPIIVTYWGGYSLPGEAPYPLKSAVAMLNMQSRTSAASSSGAAASGIRLLAHRDSRIMYHPPSQLVAKTSSGASAGSSSSSTPQAVMDLLWHYIRHEI